MTDMDEWGKDPSVQIMRKVFKGMENAQHELLKPLDITSWYGSDQDNHLIL